MLRVAIDAAPLLGQPTGVGTFTRGLLQSLAEANSLDVNAYALSGRGAVDLPGVVPSRIDARTRPMPARPLLRLWKRFNFPPAELWTGRVDVVHGTNFIVPPTKAAALVTVHDLTAIRYPELCTPTTLQYPQLIQRAIVRGAHLHVMSNAVRAEVCRHFDVAEDRVHLVEPGPPQIENAAIPGGRPYLIALGTIEPRKDYPLLVRAFDSVAREHDIDLLIIGARGWGADALDVAINQSEFGKRIQVLGYVDNGRRAGLLRGATALVYPSIYEGFGLPPLEAMSAGIPVVATSNPAVEEVTQGAASLVAPGDDAALARAIARVVSDDTHRAQLISAGQARVAQMSWQRSAENMIDLYRAIAQ